MEMVLLLLRNTSIFDNFPAHMQKKWQNGLNARALRNIASTVFAVSEVIECAAGTSVAATLKVVSYYRWTETPKI